MHESNVSVVLVGKWIRLKQQRDTCLNETVVYELDSSIVRRKTLIGIYIGVYIGVAMVVSGVISC